MAGVREKLLTASDLATLCEVDLKTIHNWVDRGRIAHFRTPGRHLRFRAADVADFLRAYGDPATARELITCHADHDDEGDEHFGQGHGPQDI